MATQDDVRSDLLELADWIEAAMGPSLDLDNAIRDLVGEPRETGGSTPRYSQSLDAAMTLVPEGCAINVVRTADGQRAHANLYRFDGNSECIPSAKFGGSATTPALALCAAALRARAHLPTTEDDNG